MGQAASSFEPRYARAWANLEAMTTEQSRLSAVDMLLGSPEYINAAKRAGIYADLLAWSSAKRRGQHYAWPRPYAAQAAPAAAAPRPVAPRPAAPPQHTITHMPPARPLAAGMPPAPAITRAPPRYAPPPTLHVSEPPRRQYASEPVGNTELTKIPPPKRALDHLTECYMLLELDDSKPLTHETLRKAYKMAAIRAHPDKGGSAEVFDSVNRAFLYIEEVLNKLLPKSSGEKADPRFTMTVTPESALRSRGDYVPGSAPAGGAAPPGSLTIEDAPPQIALNPKKLDMALFNKLFEENKLVDPDTDGYGDWLKSNEGRNDMVGGGVAGKVSADTFNRVFADSARKATNAREEELTRYKPPSDLVLSPGFGTTIGGGRPEQYTKSTGSMSDGGGLAYTDLKYAYGEGSTFSQDAGPAELLNMPKDAPLPGRARSMKEAERDYGSAPSDMTPEQAAAVRAFEAARAAQEQQRQQRAAARDVDIETQHSRLKNRLLIRE
jgi:hypothetical protein